MGTKLLDCTLRDGGHINNSLFGKKVIDGIVHKMYSSNVDYLEVGFLRTDLDSFTPDMAVFSSIRDAEKRIPKLSGATELVLMAQEDQFDVTKLELCSEESRFKTIRVSFHDYDSEQGFAFCKEVIKKGYQCCINPINLPGYTDYEILKIVQKVNELNPMAFTIVDTFGSLQKQDLNRIYYLVENNLNKDISIGLHLHENLSLAFSLGQEFLNIKNPCRNVIVDGSLYGMGRVPGNLNIELMMDYMNLNYGAEYVVEEALEAIDEFITSIKKKTPWGYSIAYSLSAKNKAHRTYAEYLLQKGKITIADINSIMKKIESSKKSCFDEKYAEQLYHDHMNVLIDDTLILNKLKEEYQNKKIGFIAPGRSIQEYRRIEELFKSANTDYIYCLNFLDDRIFSDGIIYTNQKRYGNDNLRIGAHRLIVTSNIRGVLKGDSIKLAYSTLTKHFGYFSDSSLLMILNFAYLMNSQEVHLIGFDGFGQVENFYSEGYDREQNYQSDNRDIKQILPKYASRMKICFLTPSKYEDYIND